MTPAIPIRVVLEPLSGRAPGARTAWAVVLEGRTIIPRAHDPEHEAARWLRDHGYAGPMETAREDGIVCMRYPDLARTADWTVADRAGGGFNRRRHAPWSAESAAALHTSDAGSPQAPPLVPEPVPAPVPVYDET